jgi:zinc protease
MRRTKSKLTVLGMVSAVLLAACSGSPFRSAIESTATTAPGSTAGSTPSSVPSSRGSESPVETSPVETSLVANTSAATDAAPDRDVVPLPGLLDPSDDVLPNDEMVRTGTLDNGLQYYVRNNDNPGAKASMQLAIKAGSVDELGDSTGLAHFVEHMLFNGTELFPENELIDVLRSFGAEFGPDINAYTSFGETVYQLSVPNADESVAVGMQILEQWLSHATFDDAQVQAERGVVLDEWRRSTQSASGRLFDIAQAMYLTGTGYLGRSPIGSDTSIESMTTAELVEYYRAWYRPDNAAVVVVGDIDVDDVVDQIAALFAPAAPARPELPERPNTTFELRTTPQFALHADPDQTTVDVEVTLPLPAVPGAAGAANRAQLLDEVIFSSILRRLDQDVAAGSAPFDEIGPGSNSIVNGLDAPALYAFTDEARVDETLRALLDEYERAYRFGFSAEEVGIAVAELQAVLDGFYAGRDSLQDTYFADVYVQSFLTGAAYPSVEVEYEVASAELAAITPEAVGLRFNARWTNTAPHVIISTPEASAGEMPSEAEVFAAIEATNSQQLVAREALRDLPDQLMDRPPAVEPVAENFVADGRWEWPTFDPLEVVFDNGVRAVFTSNTIVEGRVYMQGSSPGGTSLVADEDVIDALYAPEIVLSSGIADYNAAEFAQITSAADVNLGAWSTPYLDNFGGDFATADAEALFQQLHLYMTDARFDEVALGQVRSQVGPVVRDPSTDRDLAMGEALNDTRYAGEPRYTVLPTPEEFATLDLSGVERVWNASHSNASDWTFVFAGDFDIDEFIELAGAYLGSLPGTGSTDQPIDVEPPPPAGVVRVDVNAGAGDSALATLLFTTDTGPLTEALRAEIDVAQHVIDARLTDVVREEFGESYSPYSQIVHARDPELGMSIYVSVSGSPARMRQVVDLVTGELADLAATGPTPDEFDLAFAQVEEAYQFVNNGEFVDELINDALYSDHDIVSYVFGDLGLGDVSAAAVQSFIAAHAPIDQFIVVTGLPR